MYKKCIPKIKVTITEDGSVKVQFNSLKYQSSTAMHIIYISYMVNIGYFRLEARHDTIDKVDKYSTMMDTNTNRFQ